MPTYTCSIPANRWTDEQKQAVAQAIAVNHSAATGAPPNLVHVLIQECPGTMRFVGGVPEEEHIWIVGYIRDGRDDQTIGRLMLSIMRSVSRISGVDEHFVWIYICPVASAHMVKYGGIHPQPGKEKPWFEAMPEHVRAYLERQRPPESAAVFLDGIFTDIRIEK
jgi:phenylpyruvate tautomerase PptA (4-oxalocrotonate tautomerase family)